MLAFICAAVGPLSDGSGCCRLTSSGASPQQMWRGPKLEVPASPPPEMIPTAACDCEPASSASPWLSCYHSQA